MMKQSTMIFLSQNEDHQLLYQCKVTRKHFFRDQSYFLYLYRDQLIMGAKQNDTNPKYVLHFTQDTEQNWLIEGNNLVGFKYHYRGKIKDFYGQKEDMIELKQKMGGLILYTEFKKHYKNITQLQTGNFGRVTKELCKFTQNVVAVKHLKIDGKTNFQYQVRNEVDILKKINHPNVLKLYEVYKEDKEFKLVLEMIEGDNLKQLLEKRSTPYSHSEVLDISEQILSGLSAIHRHSIIHRDLKPSNIMYHNKRIKIIDFGFACFNGRQMKEFPNCGTTGYTAPEVLNVWRLKQVYDMKADIFSFGCILYRLLTLDSVFHQTTEEDTFISNRDCQINIKEKGIYFDLVKIFLKQQPEDRPNSEEALQVFQQFRKEIFLNVNAWYDKNIKKSKKIIFQQQEECLTNRINKKKICSQTTFDAPRTWRQERNKHIYQ